MNLRLVPLPELSAEEEASPVRSRTVSGIHSTEGVAIPLPPPSGEILNFRAMYDAEVDFVWRNLRRLGILEHDVDDKTQEVFVVAHRRFAEFTDRGFGIRAWLFQILLRVASDARRHRKRHPEVPDLAAIDLQQIEAPQTSVVARRQACDRLDRLLSQLDDGRRTVLILYEIEEMTAPEIAVTLGLPINTVYSRLRVARAEFDRLLQIDTRQRTHGGNSQ